MNANFLATVREYFERYDRNVSGLTPLDLTKNRTKILEAASEIRSFYFGTSPIAGQTDAIVKVGNVIATGRSIVASTATKKKIVEIWII